MVLHKDYKADYYFWEPLLLLQRLSVTGFVRLLPETNKSVRIIVGLLVVLIYLLFLTLASPYKRKDVASLAVFANTCLFFVFMGGLYINIFDGLRVNSDRQLAADVMGFVSTTQIAVTMLIINLGVLIVYILITIQQVACNIELSATLPKLT